MDRRDFLKMSGAIGVSAAVSPLLEMAAAQTTRPNRPNILLFFTDDHGAWAQHANGNKELHTPNLDGLAARGVRMTQAYTTCPVCSPARASFFTGRMPSQHGIHDWLNDGVPGFNHPGLAGQTLISELLQSAGYHTGLIGKWHCVKDREPKPGFDRWFSYWVSQYPHFGAQNFSDDGKHIVENGYQSPLLTDRAIAFLRDHHKKEATDQKPFFLFVGYVDTHSPHKQAPPDLVKQYDSATFADIPNEAFAECHGTVVEKKAADPARERERLAEYYGAVSSIDREIGRLIDELKSSGQLDNTLIIYTGDHGLNTGHHGVWEKGNATSPQNFLDESVRVNCTFSWPSGGILQNAACNDIVNHCDLWATLLDIAGATPNPAALAKINSPGRSYLPQLTGQRQKDWPDAQVSEYGNARMIRTLHHKLILRYPYAGKTYPNEFYDLAADPRETVNQFKNAQYLDTIKSLSARMNEFFAKYTIPGRSGLRLEEQPICNRDSPWLRHA